MNEDTNFGELARCDKGSRKFQRFKDPVLKAIDVMQEFVINSYQLECLRSQENKMLKHLQVRDRLTEKDLKELEDEQKKERFKQYWGLQSNYIARNKVEMLGLSQQEQDELYKINDQFQETEKAYQSSAEGLKTFATRVKQFEMLSKVNPNNSINGMEEKRMEWNGRLFSY